MKKRNIIIITTIIIMLIIAIIIGNLKRIDEKKSDNLKIVTSFYPIYIMTLNITNNTENVEVSNMAENYVGCIHNYTLTTTDLKKFENADIFVENGYGMEQFSQKIIDSYPNVKIIDSSTKITQLADVKAQNQESNTISKKESEIIQNEDEINPHFWTSIDNYILQVEAIADELEKLDSSNSEIYEQNKNTYVQKLQNLKNEYAKYGFVKNITSNNNINNDVNNNDSSLENSKQVISLNESFSYLFKFIDVNETLVETDHEQSSLSAETVKEIIEKEKNLDIKAIVIGQNDEDQKENLIAKETGAKVYRLNDGMSGDGSLDSYINTMKENLEILKTMF